MGSRTVLLMMAAYHQDMIMHQHGRLEMIFLKHMIVGMKPILRLVKPNNLLLKIPEAHHQHTCMTSGRTHPRTAHAIRTPGSFESSYREVSGLRSKLTAISNPATKLIRFHRRPHRTRWPEDPRERLSLPHPRKRRLMIT